MIIIPFTCQLIESETLVFLDESIVEIRVTVFKGMQIISEEDAETLFTFTDPKVIAVIEKVFTTAVLHEQIILPSEPEFHFYVHYEQELPVHAFHLWLGNDEEQSLIMYMCDEMEKIYFVHDEMAKRFRLFIHL